MDDRFTSPQSREFAEKVDRIFFMARLGRLLRFHHDAIVRQPLPDELQELVARLERAGRAGNWT